MPIYPSVITGTKAHKHESSSATGGPLDFSNVTLSSLNDGSMTYVSGGSGALQELAIGGVGEQLVVSGANVPSWTTGHIAGKLIALASYKATIAELSHQFTFTPALDLMDTYSELIIVGNLWGTATLGVGGLRVNGAVATYNQSGGYQFNGTTLLSVLDATGTSIVLFPASTNVASTGVLFNCNLQFMKTGGGGVSCYACHTETVSDGGIHAGRNSSVMDGTNTNSLADTLSSLTIFTAGNWQIGTTITIYGVLRT